MSFEKSIDICTKTTNKKHKYPLFDGYLWHCSKMFGAKKLQQVPKLLGRSLSKPRWFPMWTWNIMADETTAQKRQRDSHISFHVEKVWTMRNTYNYIDYHLRLCCVSYSKPWAFFYQVAVIRIIMNNYTVDESQTSKNIPQLSSWSSYFVYRWMFWSSTTVAQPQVSKCLSDPPVYLAKNMGKDCFKSCTTPAKIHRFNVWQIVWSNIQLLLHNELLINWTEGATGGFLVSQQRDNGQVLLVGIPWSHHLVHLVGPRHDSNDPLKNVAQLVRLIKKSPEGSRLQSKT